MTLLLLAGGMGSRYGGNKQFDSLGPYGELLLEFNLFDGIQAGFQEVVVVTGQAKRDEIFDYLRAKLPTEINLSCVVQRLSDVPFDYDATKRKKPWGTAHAVLSARKVVNNPFVTLNADDHYGAQALKEAYDVCQKVKENTDSLGIITYRLGQTLSAHGAVSRGICGVRDGFLQDVIEYTQLEMKKEHIIDQETMKVFSSDTPTSMNLWVLQPLIFDEIENQLKRLAPSLGSTGELYLPDVVTSLLRQKSVMLRNRTTESHWHGMTYREDRQLVVESLKRLTEEGQYPSPLWT